MSNSSGEIPIVSVVGRSGSGKTTVIERLIVKLKERGYRVATVKHDVHGFEIDHEGKDTWRHRRAGAHTTIISSPRQLALIRDVNHDCRLDELCSIYIRDVDIILSEGYKRDVHPKIEIIRRTKAEQSTSGSAPGLLCAAGDDLRAVVSDEKPDNTVPCFGFGDIEGLVDFMIGEFLE